MVTARQTGVFFCKYPCEHEAVFAREIRNRLTEETGVDLGIMEAGGLPKSDFPHGRFLRNAHENTKKLYRDSFKWLQDISF